MTEKATTNTTNLTPPEIPIPEGQLRELRLNDYRLTTAQRMVDGIVSQVCRQSGADPKVKYEPDLARKVLIPVPPRED
jgi:hypothetical protein